MTDNITGKTYLERGKPVVVLAILLLLVSGVQGQNQQDQHDAAAKKKLQTKIDECKQSTLEQIDVWLMQIRENLKSVEKLSYQELEDRIETIMGCTAMLTAQEARQDPIGLVKNTSPRILAYQLRAGMVEEAYRLEQNHRLLDFIESKGLTKAFQASTYSTPK